MGQFYDQLGNMCHAGVAEFAGEIGRRASELMDIWFAEGMTILEGRAIGSYLESQISTSVTMALMHHPCKLAEAKGASDEVSGQS